MPAMLVSSRRSSSKGIALTAALTVVVGGKTALANTAGLGKVCVTLKRRQAGQRGSLRVNAAVPCLPSEDEFKNFDVTKHCNTVQIVRGSCPFIEALEFGWVVLGGVWQEMSKGAAGQHHESNKKVVLDLAANLYSEWAPPYPSEQITPEQMAEWKLPSQNMTSQLITEYLTKILFAGAPKWKMAPSVDRWAAVNADWLSDIWSDDSDDNKPWSNVLRGTLLGPATGALAVAAVAVSGAMTLARNVPANEVTEVIFRPKYSAAM
ncbi:hypothetical protein GNI_056280 [Gregarina niphandrodes]|uniref:Uncharacterized protein n=1 Tax=Gregarina niphandrodes TaxID=110365 RepID=A0A023B8X3_GRENI|nr:hypothetical protein GNI_056280 [Gregarina niphandrodes]EZG70305.1 hypothetical protein GNI_056280 [Gregarina niphandrodes]|eukprot:XP_011129967.1 hypothetical protein GNI_056280 [Gregarina niphandrodes]